MPAASNGAIGSVQVIGGLPGWQMVMVRGAHGSGAVMHVAGSPVPDELAAMELELELELELVDVETSEPPVTEADVPPPTPRGRSVSSEQAAATTKVVTAIVVHPAMFRTVRVFNTGCS